MKLEYQNTIKDIEERCQKQISDVVKAQMKMKELPKPKVPTVSDASQQQVLKAQLEAELMNKFDAMKTNEMNEERQRLERTIAKLVLEHDAELSALKSQLHSKIDEAREMGEMMLWLAE